MGFPQLFDAVVALFLHLAPASVLLAFRNLVDTTDTSTIDLSVFAKGLQPARGTHVDGVYLRFVSPATARKYGLETNFGPYIGISVDVGSRQRGHDCYIPVNKMMGNAVSQVPAPEWESRLVWQAGPTGLSELPKPVACLIESILIGKPS